MKQIFTLLAIVFFAAKASAQFTQNFENYSSLSSNCWQLISTRSITGNVVINGAASIGTDPTVNSEIRTPYLDFTGSCTVSFKYRLNNKLNNNSTRTVEVGTTDKYGTFVAATSFTMDRTTSFNTTFTFNQTLQLTSSTKRLTIRVSTVSGDGNSYLIIDDLSVTPATLHYGTAPCNTAPVATDANYSAVGYAPFNGNLSTKASDANTGEVLAFALDNIATTDGTLTFNSDGTFVFTPAATFSGGTVTFTYHVTDDGYDPLSSNVATVTIVYPKLILLPVRMTGFSGNGNNGKAQLYWSVTQNEEGNYFQVEKSNDGKTFVAAAIVMTTGKAGSETYSYADAKFSGTTYYRLKVVNKAAAVFYSKMIVLKEAEGQKTNNLTILQNPVASSINFAYAAATNGISTINLYNQAGVIVYTTQAVMHKGSNVSLVNVNSRITPGAYFMEIVDGSDRSTAKLMKL